MKKQSKEAQRIVDLLTRWKDYFHYIQYRWQNKQEGKYPSQQIIWFLQIL